MPARNYRRLTTLNVQSDPADHGNTHEDGKPPQPPTVQGAINISKTSTDPDKWDPMSDTSTISMSKSSPATRKNGAYVSYMKKIPPNSTSRTRGNADSASSTVRSFSAVQLYSPPKKSVWTSYFNERADSKRDELIVDSLEGSAEFLKSQSITNMRPELIASFDWMPARTQSGRKGTIESLIEFRWAMQQLQIENVEETIKKLKAADIGRMYTQLSSKYEQYSGYNDRWIDYRYQILEVLASAKKALDIKDNSSSLFMSTHKIFKERSQGRSGAGQTTRLGNLFINDLGFSEEGFDRFSNSKVYGQLLLDLYFSCRYHSPALLSDKQTPRQKDRSPTRINGNWIPSSKRYKFRGYKIGNKTRTGSKSRQSVTKFDATQSKDYQTFLSSLPIDDSDKIKVLILAISQELRVSAGIGYFEETGIGKRFRVDSSANPFWMSIGNVRKDILDDGTPRGSLSSFVLLEDDDGRLVLPFETRRFVNRKGKTAMSGATALVDGIIRFGQLQDGLNTGPFLEFSRSFKATTDDAIAYIDGLMNLDDKDQKLHPVQIFQKMLGKMQRCIDGLQHEKLRNENELIIASLLNLSRDNTSLRHLFLRLILEARDLKDHETTNTGIEDQLEPDADNPRPRPIQVANRLTTIGTYPHQMQMSTEDIARRFGVSMTSARKMQVINNRIDNRGLFGENVAPPPPGSNPSVSSQQWKDSVDYFQRELAQMKRMGARQRQNEEEENERISDAFTLRWQATAERLALLAYKHMEEIRNAPEPTPTKVIVPVDTISIVQALKWGVKNLSVISRLIALSKELQETAYELADRDSGNGVFMDERRLTKYSGWDENALLATMFEVFTLLFSRYVNAEFTKSNKKIYIKYSPGACDRAHDAIRDAVVISKNGNDVSRAKQLKDRLAEDNATGGTVLTKDMIEGKLSVMDALQSVTNGESPAAVFSDIHSFSESFQRETDIINVIISQLSVIANSLDSSSKKVSDFLDSDEVAASSRIRGKGLVKHNDHEESSKIRRWITSQARSNFGRSVIKSLTPHQLALNRVAASKLCRKEGDESYLPAELVIEAEEIAALKAFLNEPSMRGVTGGNIRVMTVGIPMDTIDVLQNPPYRLGGRRNTELSKAKGVFEVHVHKRDLEFEDIVFKPKKFIYDRSLFLMSEAFKNVTPTSSSGSGMNHYRRTKTWTFNNVVRKVEFTEATAEGLKTRAAMDIFKDRKYTKMSDKQRIQMIQNHVSNKLLHLYYRLVAGLTMDENAFIQNPSWNQLLIDGDGAKMIQVAQVPGNSEISPQTWPWFNTGTIPAGNLMFRDPTINRTRVSTYKDAAQWTQPTLSSLSSLARSSAYSKFGPPRGYRRFARMPSYRSHMLQTVHYRHVKKIASSVALGSGYRGSFWKKVARAVIGKKKNPPPPPGAVPAPVSPQVWTAASNSWKAWNEARKKYNKKVAQDNRKAFKHNKKLGRAAHWRRNWMMKRYYSKKPRIRSEMLQHFRMICASGILGPSAMVRKVMAPRVFDKVLMLPVDPDDFEIDMFATKRLLRKKSSAEKQAFLDMTYEEDIGDGKKVRKVKKRRRSENYSSFNDFFVSISTINEEGD